MEKSFALFDKINNNKQAVAKHDKNKYMKNLKCSDRRANLTRIQIRKY